MSGSQPDDVSGYPVQVAKVQVPPLRDETLARDRLLDWLAVKVHHRIVLVLADAGYGKTTLLADFSNRTRLRTLWYRLDEDDRDWITLLHHLVAAGRESDPAFAPRTAALLTDDGLVGASRDAVIATFLRELPSVAEHGAVLILDDYHLVDDAPDVRLVTRELVAKAPERLSIVFSSRRPPSLPLSRLRSIGEVAELATNDLRFDLDETARLFRDAYGRPLEPDVVVDVVARTEGWAASLSLVNAALRDRSPAEVRRFVRSLTGADHELYDYLAEEVIGDLPIDLQEFLMRTAILQAVAPDLAEVAAGTTADETHRLTSAAERLTLLGRRGRGSRSELRYHPLVREFLEARLVREHGAGEVTRLHRSVARYAERRDWRVAAHHHWLAGDRGRALELIDDSAQSIIGRGEYLLAAPFVAEAEAEGSRASFQVLLSRRDFKAGDIRQAVARAERAVEMDAASPVALANLASLSLTIGDAPAAERAARRLLSSTQDDGWKGIAEGFLALSISSTDGDLADVVTTLEQLAARQRSARQTHFEGITKLNLADAQRARGMAAEARDSASASVELLESTSSLAEASSGRAILAWAATHLGNSEEGASHLAAALSETNSAIRIDVLTEAAQLEAHYGDIAKAWDYIDELRQIGSGSEWAIDLLAPTMAYLELRAGHVTRAKHILDEIDESASTNTSGHKAHVLAVRAHERLASGPEAATQLKLARDQAQAQQAGLWLDYCQALEAVYGSSASLDRFIRTRGPTGMWVVSYVAEQTLVRLNDLSEASTDLVWQEAGIRASRWRPALRAALDTEDGDHVDAARLLEAIGTAEDVVRLRRLSRRLKTPATSELGRSLARRVAPPVRVNDLGRVTLTIGGRLVEGSAIRRKVLALLCFLVSRTRFSATREEVMEALWPDFDPEFALNSLNQTVYFLRRVFEPAYKEDLSPGYVHHESDLIWLDEQLIASSSHDCMELVRTMNVVPTPDDVERLCSAYVGQFALDFSYEDWATDHRSSLHAAYLQVVEKSVASDIASGHYDRGIAVARRALETSPEADQIELSLLRLYRLNGAHAAAAEQYTHYATQLRDNLGIEPPTLDSL